MNRTIFILAIAASLVLAACSGDYSSGGNTNITPPVQAGAQNPALAASPNVHPSGATPTPSAPPGNTATYSLAEAPNGIRCPEVDGYSCILRLNVPAPTPTPKGHATASPTPTPTPSPAPSGSPSPSPSPTPAVTLSLESKPRDVPAMASPPSGAVSTTALVALRTSMNQDTAFHGSASIEFMLPQDQIGARTFAVELFHETLERHNRRNDAFIGSYSRATINGSTVTFSITPPQVTTKQGETWLLVLYASDMPSATASPHASPSASPGATSSPAPSPSTSP